MELELLDNSALDADKDTAAPKEKPAYTGPERRMAHRRCGHDRRSLVRFELDKADRRQQEDRRSISNIWDKGHTLF